MADFNSTLSEIINEPVPVDEYEYISKFGYKINENVHLCVISSGFEHEIRHKFLVIFHMKNEHEDSIEIRQTFRIDSNVYDNLTSYLTSMYELDDDCIDAKDKEVTKTFQSTLSTDPDIREVKIELNPKVDHIIFKIEKDHYADNRVDEEYDTIGFILDKWEAKLFGYMLKEVIYGWIIHRYERGILKSDKA